MAFQLLFDELKVDSIKKKIDDIEENQLRHVET